MTTRFGRGLPTSTDEISGLARHQKNDCARRRFARLLRVMQPKDGWSSPAQAAWLIERKLIPFIQARRLSIVCDANLRRTLVRWVRKHPIVQAAYLAACNKAQ